ncbi:MAG: DMT family transporter [Clostridiales bacterium]|nr:DMT family transporter [Clostridiales bacterium]
MELDKKKEVKADMMLMVITLCWGLSYYFMDICLEEMGAFTLNSYRFLGAFAVALILSYKKFRNVSRDTLLASIAVGATLVVVYAGATFGVQYTTLSNTAFLCSTTVVATPIMEFIFFRKVASKKILLAVGVCMVGIMLLTLKEDFSLNMSHLKGDLFSLSAGSCYALDIIVVDKAVRKETVDPYQMGVLGLGVTGAIMLILSLIFEGPVLPQTAGIWAAVIFLSLFCTGLAFILQPIAQQYTEPSHVGIIYSLEPVFAGITAFILAGEVLTARGYLGEVLMIASVFIMEIDFGGLIQKHKKIGQDAGVKELLEDEDHLPRP